MLREKMLLDILSVLSGLLTHSLPWTYKIQLISYAGKLLQQSFFSLDHHFGISPLACQAHLVLRQDSFAYHPSICIFKKDVGIKPMMPGVDALVSVMNNHPGYMVKGSHLFVQ